VSPLDQIIGNLKERESGWLEGTSCSVLQRCSIMGQLRPTMVIDFLMWLQWPEA
jgi:hypothetical protein